MTFYLYNTQTIKKNQNSVYSAMYYLGSVFGTGCCVPLLEI